MPSKHGGARIGAGRKKGQIVQVSFFGVMLGGWLGYLIAGFIRACILIVLARMVRRTV